MTEVAKDRLPTIGSIDLDVDAPRESAEAGRARSDSCYPDGVDVESTIEPPPRGGTPRQFISFAGFGMGEAGLVFEAGKEPIWISGPIEIVGRARDITGSGWGLLLRWHDGDGRPHEWIMPQALVHADGSRIVQHLADGGLTIGSGHRVRAKLLEYLAGARPERRITVVSRTGWHDLPEGRAFVLPDKSITADGLRDDVVLQGGEVGFAEFTQLGTLEGWRESVARVAQGHARLTFVLSAALAGPLLGLLDAEGGGFHFFGSSSRGKSTALQIAASAWGRGGTPGFVRSWRTTSNGLEGTAALHADTLLVLDELGQATSRAAGEAAYFLANGIGKTRASRTGEARAPTRWCLLFLSTGEVSLADKLAEEDSAGRMKAGQAVRVIDLPADAGQGAGIFDEIPNGRSQGTDPGQILADALKAAAVRDYGHAGPAFVRVLLGMGIDTARKRVRELGADFIQKVVPSDADAQVRRVAARFALVAAAGELAAASGIVPWPEGTACTAAGRLFGEWILMRGGTGAAEIRSGIAQVRKFLEAHGDSRFEQIGAGPSRPVQQRAGFTRGTGEDRQWLILPETWRTEIARGYDPSALMRALAERGMSILGERDGDRTKLQRKERSPLGNQRFYVITGRVLEDEEIPKDE